MNKYRSSMEKITVTPAMEERILKKLADQKRSNQDVKKRSLKHMRYAVPVAVSCAAIICVLMVYPLLKNNGGNQQIPILQSVTSGQGSAPPGSGSEPNEASPESGKAPVKAGNPIVDTKDLAELKKLVSFQLIIPEKIPAGYHINRTSVISGKLAQIIYSDGKNQITFRAAEGLDDISGDNASYPESGKAKAGGAEVKLSGSNASIFLAAWTNDGCSYSLAFSAGMTKNDVTAIIESMKSA